MKPLDSRDCDLAEAVKDKVLVTSGFRIDTGQQISWWGTNSYFVLNIPGFNNPLNTLIQVKEMHGDFGRAKITVGFKVSTNNMTDITLRFLFFTQDPCKKFLLSGDLCKQSHQAGHPEMQTLCPGPSCFLHSSP